MIRRKRIAKIVVAVVAVLAIAALSILGTAAGTRWLYARALPYLPSELTIDDLGGTVLGGLRAGRVSWNDDGVEILATAIDVDVELLPLLKKHVSISTFGVGSLDVNLSEPDKPPETSSDPLVLRLPVTLSFDDARIKNVVVRTADSSHELAFASFSGNWTGTRLSVASVEVDSSWVEISSTGNALLEPPYAATVRGTWQWRGTDGAAFGGELSLRGDTTSYRVEHQLVAPHVIRTIGNVILSESTWSVNLDNEWDRIELVLGDRLVNADQGHLVVVGNVEQYDIEAQATISAAELPSGLTSISATGNRDGADITAFAFGNEVGAFDASGRLDWSPTLGWALDVVVQRFDPA